MGAGYDADGHICWNNPLNNLGAGVDFCGNSSGVTTTAPLAGRSAQYNRELPDGFTFFTDNGDGTIPIDLRNATYTDCVADVDCIVHVNSSDVFAQWRVNAHQVVPVPAAVWLFGSALGLLGWLCRKNTS